MSDLTRSVPSAARLLAETVREYRRGFPGIARAFLPVFAVFAAGQIGGAVLGDPTTFGGIIVRGLALAGVGVVEIVLQALATGGVLAARENLPRASLREIYRAGGRVFWPVLWVTTLVAVALGAAPFAALVAAPFAAQVAAWVTSLVTGQSLAASLVAAVVAIAVVVLASLALALVLVLRFAFALPLVASGRARGVRALERSAGLSERRAWLVARRLGAGLAVVGLVSLPFTLLIAATSGPVEGALAGSSWAWSLFAGGYLLVAVPFGALYLARLTAELSNTAAEAAVARERRPWVRGLLWGAVAALALWILLGLAN